MGNVEAIVFCLSLFLVFANWDVKFLFQIRLLFSSVFYAFILQCE